MDDLANEAQRWERRARQLLQAAAVADATTAEAALQAIVDAVCRGTGWPVGHVLVRNASGNMVSARVWHTASDAKFATFRQISEQASFPPGVGLPGRVLEAARPIWIMDVSKDGNFPRARVVADLEVKAAFGFPVVVQGVVVAVLEFFSGEAREPDEPLLDVMASIGTGLAHTMERLSMIEALKESELRFRSVADTASDAIVTANGDGHIVSWNPGAESMFGRTAAEALRRPLEIIIAKSSRKALAQGLARVRAGGSQRGVGGVVDIEGLRRDGSRVPVELSLATWEIANERFYSGIFRDITERKRVEQQLRDAALLEASQRAAVEASRAKSLFVASMSHELRTPLNAILGFVQLMDRDKSLSAEHRSNLAIILRSGEHLLGLINDVLSISKIEAGEEALHPSTFDSVHLLESLREMFHLRAESRGLSLAVEASRAVPRHLHGDELKLRQVLINLLGNAVKFTSAGSVTLRVGWGDGRAVFEVEDTGPGISDESRIDLFKPFVQAAAGIRAREGTGLGLAISRNFVRLMGGELGVRSVVGKGACFRFEIPLAKGDAKAAAPPSGRIVALAHDEGPRRILVVDNSDAIRRLLARLLSGVGFQVAEAADGEVAVAEWSRFAPHLVLMDMRMPVHDGYEATRAIRNEEGARGGGSRTVIIALTGSAFEDDRPSILAAGCDEIIAKPFNEASIFDAMRRRLGVTFIQGGQSLPPAAPTLSRAQVETLPDAARRALLKALSAGDDLSAHRVVDGLPTHDEPLIAALRQMVKDMRLDELLLLLETEVAR